MKRFAMIAALLAGLAVLASGGWYLWQKNAPRETPAGQPPLAALDARELQVFRAAFNEHAGRARILALLSPT